MSPESDNPTRRGADFDPSVLGGTGVTVGRLPGDWTLLGLAMASAVEALLLREEIHAAPLGESESGRTVRAAQRVRKRAMLRRRARAAVRRRVWR